MFWLTQASLWQVSFHYLILRVNKCDKMVFLIFPVIKVNERGGDSGYWQSACLASAKSWIQFPVPKKENKYINKKVLVILHLNNWSGKWLKLFYGIVKAAKIWWHVYSSSVLVNIIYKDSFIVKDQTKKVYLKNATIKNMPVTHKWKYWLIHDNDFQHPDLALHCPI